MKKKNGYSKQNKNIPDPNKYAKQSKKQSHPFRHQQKGGNHGKKILSANNERNS